MVREHGGAAWRRVVLGLSVGVLLVMIAAVAGGWAGAEPGRHLLVQAFSNHRHFGALAFFADGGGDGGGGTAGHDEVRLGIRLTAAERAAVVRAGPVRMSPRHVFSHGVGRHCRYHRRLDLADGAGARDDNGLQLDELQSDPTARPLAVRRIVQAATRLADRSPTNMHAYRRLRQSGAAAAAAAATAGSFAWQRDDVVVPDMNDFETVLALAEIAANAYIEVPDTEDWIDVGARYNASHGFGWDTDGLRGHVFADADNQTVIIALKGTTLTFLDSRDSKSRDKHNDNILFSCCCARVSYLWQPVCDCYDKPYECNLTCLEHEVAKPDHYYAVALEIFANVTALYPNSNIWMVGHSLGGAIAALTGLTYGVPVVTFEAPGDQLAAQRLHLPQSPGLDANDSLIWHIGHTADPIFLGVCTGPSSGCWYAGYALETACHNGLECIYDVVSDMGWRVNVGSHRIRNVIDDVITAYNTTPVCKKVEGCLDCYQWVYSDH